MRNDRVAWEKFELMIRSGVPHALDIASELVRHNLRSPLHATDQKEIVDLKYYCVIHRAYRLGVLPKWMDLIESLKQLSCWTLIRDRQDIQLWIVEICSKGIQVPPFETDCQFLDFLSSAKAHLKKGA
ncbi:MAG: hypothetical protein U0930_02560 [Pirellulales bacterium]